MNPFLLPGSGLAPFLLSASVLLFLLLPVSVLVLCGVVVVYLQSHARRSFLRLSWCAGGVLALLVLSVVAKIQTASGILNVVFCCVALLAYVCLASAAWTARPQVLGLLMGTALNAPLVAPCVLLIAQPLVALTVGVFILEDAISPPMREEQLGPTLSCSIRDWGASFTDEGYTVYVYRHLPFFPLVRREVTQVTVNETEPGDGPRSATCAGVAAGLSR